MGSPTALGSHSPLWNWSPALFGLYRAALPIALDPSPSEVAKEVPRMDKFLPLTPSGGPTKPTREVTHYEMRLVTRKPPASVHLHQRGPYQTTVHTGFRLFPT